MAGNPRNFSPYVDVLVQNSGCFVFEHYVSGLKKYIRSQVRAGALGKVRPTPIDSSYINRSVLALLLGETNRMSARYPMIESLLTMDPKGFKDVRSSDYYKDLMLPFLANGLIFRVRAEKNVLKKAYRVIKINSWFAREGNTLSGLNGFLRGNYSISEGLDDYPIAIQINDLGEKSSYVQLDGSHRRCVAAYRGFVCIDTLVVTMEEVRVDIESNRPVYFWDHREVFFDLLSRMSK